MYITYTGEGGKKKAGGVEKIIQGLLN